MGWHIGRHEPDHREQERRRRDDSRVARLNIVQQLSKQSRQAERKDDAQRDPDAGEDHPLAHNQSNHVVALGAECRANSKLSSPLRSRVRDHAEEAQAGDNYGKGGKGAEQYRRKAVRSQRRRNHAIE